MSTRKRQRPSARDFFEFQTSTTESIQEPDPLSSALFLDFQKPQIKQENLQEYYSTLLTLDPHDRILELVRGRTDQLDSSEIQPFIFILKSKESFYQIPLPINQILQPSHIARILWGPGKIEVAHAKTIYLGPLSFSANDMSIVTTEEVYGIQFSNQRSADLATQIIEFKLNQFFLSENQNFFVQAQTGSYRWFMKDESKSMNQFDWKIEKIKIPFLRPLPSVESDSKDDLDQNNNSRTVEERLHHSLSFEISQLPKIITIPILLKNLLRFGLIDFPIQVKLTQETTTDLPIRILLKFSNSISAMISKLSLFHGGLNSQPDEQNNHDSKVVQFIIDESDSSQDDPWNIWKSALVWDQEKISDFIKSLNSVKIEKREHQDKEEETDQLEDSKLDGFGSDEFEEWATSNSTRTGLDEKRRTRRSRQTPSYRQRLETNEREWEGELKRLTLLADEEYINNRADSNPAKINTSNPNSAFYQVSQRVLENKQFHNLMNLIKTKSARRRLIREYRKDKPLSKKIKRQRRARKRGDQEADRSDEGNTDEDETEDEQDETNESESDEPDEQQLASFNEQQWKRFRQKKRTKRLMDPSLSSEDDDDKVTVSKSLITNDQVYQHKFARPNERVPGDIN